VRKAFGAIWSTVRSALGVREILLVIGACLLGYGSFLIWAPAGFVVPGAVLAYVAIFGVK